MRERIRYLMCAVYVFTCVCAYVHVCLRETHFRVVRGIRLDQDVILVPCSRRQHVSESLPFTRYLQSFIKVRETSRLRK